MTILKSNNLVSIIIPSRKYDTFLKECIENIRSLYKETEIILVLDETEDVLNIDNNIKILLANSKNMSAKRNQGVNASNSKYLAFVDSDAFPRAGWLETGINFLESNPEYSAVTGCQYLPDDDLTIQKKILRLIRFNRLFQYKEWVKIIDFNAPEQDCNEFVSANVIITKQAYIEIGGMKEDRYIGEDSEFSHRLANNKYKIRFIPKAAVYHHERDLIAFLKKTYCFGYYYANNFIKGRKLESLKRSLIRFLPSFFCVFYMVLWFYLVKNNINSLFMAVLPLILFLIFIIEVCMIAKNSIGNDKNVNCYIKTFSFSFLACFSFCVIFIASCLLGFLNFPSPSIKQMYRHN